MVRVTVYAPAFPGTAVTVRVHVAFERQLDVTAVGTAFTSPARQTVKEIVVVAPAVTTVGARGTPQAIICTTFSVTADEVLARSPFEVAFESGAYDAVSDVLPEPTCEIVSVHEPVPAEAEVRVAEQVSLKPSVTVTVPVVAALPDAGLTVKLTETGVVFTSATFVGKE